MICVNNMNTNIMFDSQRSLFVIFLVIRILMALCSNSLHHGDETYQSVEVAHKLVFGTGYLTWEWTTPNPIRSYLHPLMFSVIFFILKVFGLDSPELVVACPRIFHAIVAAVSDIFIVKFFTKTFGKKGKKCFVILYVFNYTLLYFQSRTFINSLETSLGNIALYYYSTCIKSKKTKVDKERQSTSKSQMSDRKDSSSRMKSENGTTSLDENSNETDENSNETSTKYYPSTLNGISDEAHLRHRMHNGYITSTGTMSDDTTSNELLLQYYATNPKENIEINVKKSTIYNTNHDKNSMIYVSIIALSFVLRGTTAIFWLPLVLYHCILLYKKEQVIESLINKMVPVAILVLATATVIDSFFHGKLAFTHWNFFSLNLLVDVNTQCGVSNGFMTTLYFILQLNFAIIFFFLGCGKV